MPKPELSLPSAEELSKLPPRAIVAYAVRCAQRVQPLIYVGLDDDKEAVRAANRIIQIATEFVSGKMAGIDELSRLSDIVQSFVVKRIGVVPRKLVSTVEYAIPSYSDSAAGSAVEIASDSLMALESESLEEEVGFVAAVRHDFAVLAKRAKSKDGKKTLLRGFSCGERGMLGKLWPDQVPQWYSDPSQGSRVLRAPSDPTELESQLAERIEEIASLQAQISDGQSAVERSQSELKAQVEQANRLHGEQSNLNAKLKAAKDEKFAVRQQHAANVLHSSAAQERLELEIGVLKLTAQQAERKSAEDRREIRQLGGDSGRGGNEQAGADRMVLRTPFDT
jgi:uncharacterized coiled-coil protein SlyX